MDERVQQMLHKVWPEWELVERLGSGAFATVYKAKRVDLAGTTYSAIKITEIPKNREEVDSLRSEGLSAEETDSYYESLANDYSMEIQLMDSVKGHTNIVSIDDYRIYCVKEEPVSKWWLFIRMELLTPLQKYLERKAISEKDVIKLGIDLCNALDVCEKKNIVHRDIKPANIFVNDLGYYKLGDFGVARNLKTMSYSLSLKGTPNYMAPEMVVGILEKKSDFSVAARVDIYSLGMVMYWMANNFKLPFIPANGMKSSKEMAEAFSKRVNGEKLPPPMNASHRLQQIILKACEHDPNQRYQSARDMLADLKSLQPKEESPVLADKEQPQTEGNTTIKLGKSNLKSADTDDSEKNKTVKIDNPAPQVNAEPSTRGRKKSTFVKWILFVTVAALLLFGLYQFGWNENVETFVSDFFKTVISPTETPKVTTKEVVPEVQTGVIQTIARSTLSAMPTPPTTENHTAEIPTHTPDTSSVWTCSKNHTNPYGLFCGKCGEARSTDTSVARGESATSDGWVCSQNHLNRSGIFCGQCGEKR